MVQRRGRGGSGPQGERYGIEREVEDVEAVRAETGARLIFGHSFGGLVSLRAAVGGGAYDAVTVYERGVSVDGSFPVGWIGRARREVAAGARSCSRRSTSMSWSGSWTAASRTTVAAPRPR